MGRTTQELAGSADGATMISFDSARAMERMRRELATIRDARDAAEARARSAFSADEETHQDRLDRASKLVRLRTATEDRLVEAVRDRDAAARVLTAANVAAAAMQRRAAAALASARAEAVAIIDMARSVANELETTARADAASLRAAAEEEVATLRGAAVREVAEARRMRVEAQHLHDDAQKRWLAANEAMHQAAGKLPEPTMAGSHDDMIWLTDNGAIDELDDRFEKYFALDLDDDSARDWMLGRKGS